MPNRRSVSVADCVRGFLEARGAKGATLAEIYQAVHQELGADIPTASIRAALYHRLPSDKSAYRKNFERFISHDQTKYRVGIVRQSAEL